MAADDIVDRRHPAHYHQTRDAHAMEAHEVVCALTSYQWSFEDVADLVARAQALRLSELRHAVSLSP